jgi:hypothetical protein
MILIDKTYFTGDLALPFLTTEQSGMGAALQSAKEKEKNAFIQERQDEYLELMFGQKMSEAFISGLNLPDDDPAKEIWIALKNKLIDETRKQSPIANYVYFFSRRKDISDTTPTGEKKSKTDYSVNVSIFNKSVDAWNKMVRMNKKFLRWFEENFDNYKPYWDNHSIDDDLITPINIFNL